MKLSAFHALFLLSAAALLFAVVLWLPAAGALGAPASLGAWFASLAGLVAVTVYGVRRQLAIRAERNEGPFR